MMQYLATLPKDIPSRANCSAEDVHVQDSQIYISTPGFRFDIDVEIQGIEIEADWGGIKTDLGDFSFDFSPVNISPDSIN
jgi:hypothetical protein